jgi:hypothetical protein
LRELLFAQRGISSIRAFANALWRNSVGSLVTALGAPGWAMVRALHQFDLNPKRGEAKAADVADLQPVQPFQVLSSSIETTETYFMSTLYEQRGRKVFDVYRNDKRELLVLKQWLCNTRRLLSV